MPLSLHGAAKLYVVGGVDKVGSPVLPNVDCFDFSSNTWSAMASFPDVRKGHSTGALNSRLIVTGGLGEDKFSAATTFAFDPQTNAWSPLANMQSARSSHGSAVLGGYLFVIGGQSEHKPLSTVERYDAQTNRWT